ncbi:MAG TPA: Lrp/AsnC family transcriptional regulator [Jatrophihabitans sp.]|jgi:Lrp/AsnC family leucine-responsive transcriptional regulator
MDEIDLRLVSALRTNARSTYAELARAVGLSGPAVHERVSKLESAGVIIGYHAAVAPEAMGKTMSALIGVFITDSADLAAVEADLAGIPTVEDCWFVAGEETFVVKVSVPDVNGLEEVIRSMNAVTGIAHTRTTVVLSTKFEGRLRG